MGIAHKKSRRGTIRLFFLFCDPKKLLIDYTHLASLEIQINSHPPATTLPLRDLHNRINCNNKPSLNAV